MGTKPNFGENGDENQRPYQGCMTYVGQEYTENIALNEIITQAGSIRTTFDNGSSVRNLPRDRRTLDVHQQIFITDIFILVVLVTFL